MSIKLFNKFIWSTPALFASLLFSACGSDSTSSPANNAEVILSGESISGVSQKGPFVKGSTVKLYELDEQLHQTGVHYSTTIDNDEGIYHIDSVVLTKPYAWMVVNGYFINEYTGEKSTQETTLNGLVKVEKNKDININVLSHLAFNRINYLVQQGLSIAEAQKQAEAEILKAFNFEADKTSFENMDIFANGEGDAKLLAISLILLNNAFNYDDVIARTIDRMAQITYDLETDGTWDNDSLKETIKNEIIFLTKNDYSNENTLVKTRKKMESMTTKSIPDFEKYIKKFISPDTIWGSCSKEYEIQKDYNDNRYICQDSVWIRYYGFRDVGDPVVDTTDKYGTMTDSRDGKKYKTVSILSAIGDSVTWMANSLEYEAPDIEGKICEHGKGCWYMLNDIAPQNYPQGICPENWHIPQKSEWSNMLYAIENDYQYGELLFANNTDNDDYDIHSHSNLYFMWLDYDEQLLRAFFRDGSDDQYGAGITHDPARIRCVKDYSEPKLTIDTTRYASLTDKRDGHVYKTLEVKYPDGTTATWMATLLEYEAPATSDSSVQNIPGLGRTYTYKQILNKPDDADTTELYPILFAAEKGEKVQGICPDDWHIPNNDEWKKLINEATEEDKDLLAYPQKFFNKQTNDYDIPNGYNYNFNITGSYNREQIWVFATRPNNSVTTTIVTPPYGYTDIDARITNKLPDFIFNLQPGEFVLRCVKD